MTPNAPYPQQPPAKSGMPVWLIVLLVVLLFVIAIIGILAVLAVTGVRKYISASKNAEAMSNVYMIASDGESAFAADTKLCDSASTPVPASIKDVSGKKYMSSPSDWTVDSAKHAGFACLKFEKSDPQYYQYDYKKTGPGDFTALARGDLNGDGVTSEFAMSGHVAGGTVTLDSSVKQTNPSE